MTRFPAKLWYISPKNHSPHLTGMVTALLAPNTFTTKGTTTHHTVTMTSGVPQGDPVSPALYNIFMDTVLSAMTDIKQQQHFPPASCYAEDVLLLARSASELQTILNQASLWAQSCGMKWNLTKSAVLLPNTTLSPHHSPFTLANQPFRQVLEATYLGTSPTADGTSASSTITRLQKAIKLVGLLLNCRETHHLTYTARKQITTGAIIPSVDYAIHLIPANAHVLSLDSRLE